MLHAPIGRNFALTPIFRPEISISSLQPIKIKREKNFYFLKKSWHGEGEISLSRFFTDFLCAICKFLYFDCYQYFFRLVFIPYY